jgi:twitching motility protein PilT
MAQLDQLLKQMVETGASDLHLSAGEPVRMRIDGEMRSMTDHPLSTEKLAEIMREICSETQWTRYMETHELDHAYALPGISRFRCNFLKHRRGLGAVFRVIPEKILTLEQLNVPKAVYRFPLFKSGLVLVTGPTGSGKSTTLAAIIDAINTEQAKHIITVEDPVEFVHKNKQSCIVQREVGQHTTGFAKALEDALSEDPDVVLVGEMRDLETISLAVSAAEMGILVFGTMHTNSAAKSINRIIDVFPISRKDQIGGMLAESLQGILAQQLCGLKNGKGRAAAVEVMFRGVGFGNLIREGSVAQIFSYIDSNRANGMQTMDGALQNLVQEDKITTEQALLKANDKKVFESWLKEYEENLSFRYTEKST